MARPVPEPAAPAPRRPRAALVQTILARPLFAPRRGAADPAAKPEVEAIPRLMGIVVAASLRRATFAGPNGGTPVTVGEGDRLGAYRVSAITSSRVELQGPAGSNTVRPRFDPVRRTTLAYTPPLPLIDPERREIEMETDQ